MYPYLKWMLEIDPWWIGVLAIVGLYGGARIYAGQRGLPLLFGGWDITLLSLAALCLTIALVLLMSEPSLGYDTRLDPWTIGFAASCLGSVGFTVSRASGGIGQMVASLAAKAALLLLIPVVVIPILALAFGSKSDRRYRDGTKGNQMTAMMGLGGVILAWLVMSLAQSSGSRAAR